MELPIRYTRRRPRLRALAVVVAAVFAAGPAACQGSDSPTPADAANGHEQHVRQDGSSDGTTTMARRREVFGLPLPPSVAETEQRGREVRVKTDMTLAEVKAFFTARLTDYEVLEAGYQIRLVGLRDYMPQIMAYGSGDYTFVIYSPAPPEPRAAQPAARDSSRSSSQHHAPQTGQPPHPAGGPSSAPQPLNQRRQGQKVGDRTSDGRLLAPGARWGQPYTPPPGSPLDKKHYRSNFGRPYGQWVLQ